MKHDTFFPPQNIHHTGRKHTGGFFIIFGVLFLVGMSDISIMGYSPWILMVLLPFYWVGISAYHAYQAEGRISGRVLLPLVFGLIPFAFVAAGFLGVNLAGLWPIGMIIAGGWFLFSGR